MGQDVTWQLVQCMRAIFITLAYVIPRCQQASKQSICKIGAALKGNAMATVVHHAVIWCVLAMIPSPAC